MALLILAILGLLALIGCAPKHARAYAPKACIGPMTVKDFTKPCTPISSTELMCDRVRVEINCIRYEEKK